MSSSINQDEGGTRTPERTSREKKENSTYRGTGSAVASWFQEMLRTKHLADIADFSYPPSRFYAYSASRGSRAALRCTQGEQVNEANSVNPRRHPSGALIRVTPYAASTS